LLGDLLGHEVLVAGLVDLRGLCGDPDHLAVGPAALGVADLHAGAGDIGVVALVEIGDPVRERG
jgi:hypothetical protein